jgi:hypothetical protein
MPDAISRTRIIDINALNLQSGRFKTARHQLVKRAVQAASPAGEGRANIVIHPFYCRPWLTSPQKISQNEWLQMEIEDHESRPDSSYRYSAYLKRLESYLKETLAPIFVFAQLHDRLNAEKWVIELQLTAPVVMLYAKSEDATPLVGTETQKEKAWRLFADVLTGLEIGHVVLVGEKGYTENHWGAGCVYVSLDHLRDMSFSATVRQELTYPGIDVVHWSDK